MKTFYAVAIESESSGAVDWFSDRAKAQNAFEEAVATIDFIGDDINLWAFSVPDHTTRHQITAEADRQMWELDYTAIESRSA